LAKEIDKQAKKYDRKIDVLIQVNTSNEESKTGVMPQETKELAIEILKLDNICLQGLMTIGGLGKTKEETSQEFRLLAELKDEINASLGIEMNELSMGMSSDYLLAIEKGATYVRIGTSIFGKR